MALRASVRANTKAKADQARMGERFYKHLGTTPEQLNNKLNLSEHLLVGRIGKRGVKTLVKRFRAEAEAQPLLWFKLYEHSDPYAWIARRYRLRQGAP